MKRARVMAAVLGGVLVGSLGMAPAAKAGVGNCTAGYIEQIPGTPPVNQGSLLTGYLDCVVSDQENCLVAYNPEGGLQEAADLIACTINRP